MLCLDGGMRASGKSARQNEPAGSLKGDQQGSSDRFCKMKDKFLSLKFSANSIQRNSNRRNPNY
jgi:hypothetical protein